MKNLKVHLDMRKNAAALVACALTAVLCVCANTTSSFMLYQPDTPQELNRFRYIK